MLYQGPNRILQGVFFVLAVLMNSQSLCLISIYIITSDVLPNKGSDRTLCKGLLCNVYIVVLVLIAGHQLS